MVKGHEGTAALLKKEMTSGQDEDAKAFAKSILPTVESHLKEAGWVENQVVAQRKRQFAPGAGAALPAAGAQFARDGVPPLALWSPVAEN